MVNVIKWLFKTCLVISIIVSIYCLIFWKWIKRPYRFEIYIGKPRTGKTTMMTKEAYLNNRHKKRTYCNVDIDVKGTRIFSAENIGLGNYFEPDSLVLIDEPNLYWDNRTFKDQKRKSVVEWFRLYGHNKVNIKMYTQTLDVDKKLRYLASDVFICKKILGTIVVSRKLKKQITIKESAIDAESQIVDELDFVPIFIPGSIKLTFIPHWTKFFDSYALPEGNQMPYTEK